MNKTYRKTRGWLTAAFCIGMLGGGPASATHEFTLAFLPDTQTYTSLRPQIFQAQIDWITANRVTEDIVYVGHLGDLKDVGACVNATIAWPSLGSPSTEWEIVRDAFDDLDTAGIPYGVTPGNHDFDQRFGVFPADSGGCPNYDTERPLVGYDGEFDPATLSGLFGTNYGNRLPGSNEDNYSIVSSDGFDFLIINLGYQEDAPAAGSTVSIDWAETLLTTYPNHIAIITSHFLGECNASPTGGAGANSSCAATPNYALSTYASNIITQLRGYQNLFMLIGGHRFGESYVAVDRTTEGFNPVHVVLANYQHLQYSGTNFDTVNIPGPGSGSSGYFKLMEFDVDTMTVDLDALSPALAANPGIAGGGSVLPVLSNGNRPTAVRSTRNIDPNVPANLWDGAVGTSNPTLHTQSVSNLVNISFAGYASPTPVGPTIVEDSPSRFEIQFKDGEQYVGNPVGATGGRELSIFSGGESAAIAITVVFRPNGGGPLEDLIFIFENISTDPFFPGPNNPGDVLVYETENGFAGADAVNGDGLMPGFSRTELRVIVGPTRDDPFDATLILE